MIRELDHGFPPYPSEESLGGKIELKRKFEEGNRNRQYFIPTNKVISTTCEEKQKKSDLEIVKFSYLKATEIIKGWEEKILKRMYSISL